MSKTFTNGFLNVSVLIQLVLHILVLSYSCSGVVKGGGGGGEGGGEPPPIVFKTIPKV